VLVDVEELEVSRTAVDGGEAVGLVDGDDAQPGEDRVAVGLGAQEGGPGRMAGVFDEFARRAHDACDSAVEVAVVLAVEPVLVAARRPRSSRRGFGRGLHEPRPG
jgi:hypothetical protein